MSNIVLKQIFLLIMLFDDFRKFNNDRGGAFEE